MQHVRSTEQALEDSIIFSIWQAREAAEKITECLLYPESDTDLDPAYHGEMLIAILKALADRFGNLGLALERDYLAALPDPWSRIPDEDCAF